MELSFAVARSVDKTCGICYEVLLEYGTIRIMLLICQLKHFLKNYCVILMYL